MTFINIELYSEDFEKNNGTINNNEYDNIFSNLLKYFIL